MLRRLAGISATLHPFPNSVTLYRPSLQHFTMQAVRIQPSPNKDKPYSATNPAASSALKLDTVDIPKPKDPNDIIVRVHATTIIRDTLTWPEMYSHPFAIPGHDFAGTVFSVHPDAEGGAKHGFKVGDEVYGMVHADRGQCWAQYVIVKAVECAVKPRNLSWEDAATVPLSALTAWQALFEKGGVPLPAWLGKAGEKDVSSDKGEQHKVFITGASGGVGVWLVQLAKLAGCHVVAGTTSKARSEEFLISLGADEIFEYDELGDSKHNSIYDTIIDGVAGTVLERCWSAVKDNGFLVSIHSDSFEFVGDHRQSGIARGKDDVNALFFIVEPSGVDLTPITHLIQEGKLKTSKGEIYPLADVGRAYEISHSNSGPRGRAVLIP